MDSGDGYGTLSMYLMLPNCTLTMVYFILCTILVFQHNFKTKIKLLKSSNSGFPSSSDGKEPACNAEDVGTIPESGRTPGGGNGSPLQYSCLGNPMDRRAWQATFLGVTKSWTQLEHTHIRYSEGLIITIMNNFCHSFIPSILSYL